MLEFFGLYTADDLENVAIFYFAIGFFSGTVFSMLLFGIARILEKLINK